MISSIFSEFDDFEIFGFHLNDKNSCLEFFYQDGCLSACSQALVDYDVCPAESHESLPILERGLAQGDAQ